MPSSSDEAPPQKKFKSSGSVQNHISILKNLLHDIESKRQSKVENDFLPTRKENVPLKQYTRNTGKNATKRSQPDTSESILLRDDHPNKTFCIPQMSLSMDDKLKGESEEIFDESSEPSDTILFQKSVLDMIQRLQVQNVTILDKLNVIQSELSQKNAAEVNKLSESLLEPLVGFPLHTLAEFKELEADENNEQRLKLLTHLVSLGASKLREFLNCGLKEMMTDELVSKFSWPGGESSHKFGDTKLSNVLFHAAQKCSQFRGPEDKAQFKSEMLEVLRATKQRYRKLMKKNLPTKPSKLGIDDLENAESLRKRIDELEATQAQQDKGPAEENFEDSEDDEEEHFGDDES